MLYLIFVNYNVRFLIHSLPVYILNCMYYHINILDVSIRVVNHKKDSVDGPLILNLIYSFHLSVVKKKV